jgi:hypothetical protein
LYQTLFFTQEAGLLSSHSTNYKLVAIGVEDNQPLQSHFLYLTLLTKRFPFFAKRYYTQKKYYNVLPSETSKMLSYVNQAQSSSLIARYYNLSAGQLSPEKAAFILDKRFIKIIL